MNRRQWWTFALVFTVLTFIIYYWTWQAGNFATLVVGEDSGGALFGAPYVIAHTFHVTISAVWLILAGLALACWACGFLESNQNKKK